MWAPKSTGARFPLSPVSHLITLTVILLTMEFEALILFVKFLCSYISMSTGDVYIIILTCSCSWSYLQKRWTLLLVRLLGQHILLTSFSGITHNNITWDHCYIYSVQTSYWIDLLWCSVDAMRRRHVIHIAKSFHVFMTSREYKWWWGHVCDMLVSVVCTLSPASFSTYSKIRRDIKVRGT